jgi:GNAT superfamily N-acetyltransferase
MSITLRDVTPEDDALLRQVYASTRALELEMVPWNDDQKAAFLKSQFEAQDSYYRSQFAAATFQVIVSDGEPVGRLYVLREADRIKIIDITILPEWRSQSIGTSLIRELLDESIKANQPVTIWVENFNPSQTLFRRLGFSPVQEEGFNQLLEFRPSAENQANNS